MNRGLKLSKGKRDSSSNGKSSSLNVRKQFSINQTILSHDEITDKLDLQGNAKNIQLSPLNLMRGISENDQPRLIGMKSMPIPNNYVDHHMNQDNQSGSDMLMNSPSNSYKQHQEL
jgi:hypothetical protein